MHFLKRLFLLFFLLTSLRARADELFPSDEDLTLFHHVNVLSGHLSLCFQDGVVHGAKSLPLFRSYTSAGAFERSRESWDFSRSNDKIGDVLLPGGWGFFPHTTLICSGISTDPEYDKHASAHLALPGGQFLKYTFSHREDKYRVFLKPKIEGGRSSGSIGARNNPANQLLFVNLKTREAKLFLPNGGIRSYKARETGPFMRLVTEQLPSGHRIDYSYERIRHEYEKKYYLNGVAIKNPSGTKTYASIDFDLKRIRSPFRFSAKTSDGKTFDYQAMCHKERDYLSKISSNSRPSSHVDYENECKEIGARVNVWTLDGKVQFKASYYNDEPSPKKRLFHSDKVSLLEIPAGPDGQMVPFAQFEYFEGETRVHSNGCKTIYRHDGKKLFSLETYKGEGILHSILKLIWDSEGNLAAKVSLDGASTPLFSKTFTYDSAGNVLEETLWGNLSGAALGPFILDSSGRLEGAESYTRRYTYFPSHLVASEEEESGLCFKYTYLPGTDLPLSKLTYDHDKIFQRQFCVYNHDNLLIAEMTDDGTSPDASDLTGVCERNIKRYELDDGSGLAHTITESYWDPVSQREVLLKKVKQTYSAEKRVVSEAVYDRAETHRYTIQTEYDQLGNITSKTTPLGNKNHYRFDRFSNLIQSKEVGSNHKFYTYDSMGRATSCQEVCGYERKSSFTTYDLIGKVLSQTDQKGNTTTQRYDCLGRCLQTTFPSISIEQGPCQPQAHFTYDTMGNLASTTDPQGRTTSTQYNTLRKPIKITTPDGTVLTHFYKKNGTLEKTLYCDGTTACYTHDLLGRMTTKKILSLDGTLLYEESWSYNAFSLLNHIDGKGLKTTFTYDGAGRKVSENADGRIQTYTYDALGFLESTITEDTAFTELHDIEGHVILQWEKDESGEQNKRKFVYDCENRKRKIISFTSAGEAVDFLIYDTEGRIGIHTDPLGARTRFRYEDVQNQLGQKVLQKTERDPIGNITITRYDALGHLVLLEKQNPQKQTISGETYLYDLSGNRIKRETTIYKETVPHHTYTCSWEYDSMGRVIKETEEDKTTLSTYDQRGRLSQRIFPSGRRLTYTYDPLDRLLECKGSNIHYAYRYDKGPSPTEATDLLTGLTWYRRYNVFDELLEEKHPQGFTLHWHYDTAGRCTHFQLPDSSAIHYTHEGLHLRSVGRLSAGQQLLYEHRYTHFDLNGHVSQEQLIFELGTLATSHDLLERPSSQTSPWHTEALSYGPSGLVMAKSSTLFPEKSYTYDSLNQLRSESDHTYSFDSIGNPQGSEVNQYNQILSTPELSLEYDPDGNPLKRTTSSGTIFYHYDDLSRLRLIESPEPIHFLYDPFSRLYAKETQGCTTFYLYDKEQEIGTCTPFGATLELKVLGLGLKKECGFAIALELQGQIYAPLQDLHGHIVALSNSQGQLIETYNLTAFGKESHSHPTSPWRFCGKRSEQELIFFGKRFYDPTLGRWLTPDPAGFVDGPNLYAYVLNSPLNRLDLFGLFSLEFSFGDDDRIDVPISEIRKAIITRSIIACRGWIRGAQANFFVSCGHWHKLQFSPDECERGSINLFNHLAELTPREGSLIGLFTYQNGIDTKHKEFYNIGKSLVDKVPEGTLSIGLHNPTEGKIRDCQRLYQERNGVETEIVAITRQFMCAFSEHLQKVNPDARWLDVSHSESSLIKARAIEGMNPEQKQAMKKQLMIATIGAVEPISEKMAFRVVNMYSEKDYAALWCSRSYLNNPEYPIQILPCTSRRSEMNLYFIDHGSLGMTYQKGLSNDFDGVREKHGFYKAIR